MTNKIKPIIRNIKKRIESIYIRLESEEDKEDLEEIMNLIDEKLED